MVCLTHALCGELKEGIPAMQVVSQVVDIGDKADQLEGECLCDINLKGYVPVLCNDAVLGKPMPESVDITWYLGGRYPGLLLPRHADEIRRLVHEMHDNVSFYALTFGGMLHRGLALQDILRETRPGISERWRAALEDKLQQRIETEYEILPEQVAKYEDLARAFLAKIDTVKQARGGDGTRYLYGDEPTALDGHVIPFLCRLYDKERTGLIPAGLVPYLEQIRGSETWRSILPGLSTLPDYVK